MTLDELIAKTEAKLRRETDANSYQALALKLATLKAAKDDDDSDEDDDEDEKKSKKSAKKSEEKKSEEEKASAKKSEEKKSEEKKSEEDDEEDEEKKASKAALALIETATGRKGDSALGAAAAMFARFEEVAATTARLEKASRDTEKSSLIASVKKHVPKAQIEWLEGQKLSVVRGFCEQALKGSPMVHTEEGDLLVPNAAKQNTKESLPKNIQAMIDSAVAVFPVSLGAEKKKAFEAELVRRHLEDQAKALNGATGAY